MPAGGGAAKAITSGDETIKGWAYDAAADRHVFQRDEAVNAGDVWVMAPGGGQPSRVTHLYETLAEAVQAAEAGASSGRARTVLRSMACCITRSTTRPARSIR